MSARGSTFRSREPLPPAPAPRIGPAVLPDHDLVDEAILDDLDVGGLDLSGRVAESVDVSRCRLTGTDLSGTVLTRPGFTDCVIASANLANLRGTGGALVRVAVTGSRLTGLAWI